MIDSIKKIFNLSEEDGLDANLCLCTNMDTDGEDGIWFTLELLRPTATKDELLAEIHGTIFLAKNIIYNLVDFADWMDGVSADKGTAGAFMIEFYEKNYCNPRTVYPGSVMYVHEINLIASDTQKEARGVILDNVGEIYKRCTGEKPGVVVMLFSESEKDIEEYSWEEYQISDKNMTCYVDVSGVC